MSKKILIFVTIAIFFTTGIVYFASEIPPTFESTPPAEGPEEILSPNSTELEEINLLLNATRKYHLSFLEDKTRYELKVSRVRIKLADNKFRRFRLEHGKWFSRKDVDVTSYIPPELTYAKSELRGTVYFEPYDKTNQRYLHSQQYWVTNDSEILIDNAQAYQLLELLQTKRNYHTAFTFPEKDIRGYVQRYFLDPVFNREFNSFIWRSMGYKTIQGKFIITVYEIRLDLDKKKFIVNEFPMEFSPHQGFEIACSKAQELINEEDVNSNIGMIEYNFDKFQEKDVYLLTISYGNKLGDRIANVIIDSKTGEIISAITKERSFKHPPIDKILFE